MQFHGFIDNLHISKVARHEGDFVPPKVPKADEDTLGLYLFNDMQKAILVDSSRQQNHGMLFGVMKVETQDWLRWAMLSHNFSESPYDRVAAKEVLKQGGTLRLVTEQDVLEIDSDDELPHSAFRVFGVNLEGHDLAESNLEYLSDLQHLESINLNNTSIRPHQLESIGRIRSLERIDLAAC